MAIFRKVHIDFWTDIDINDFSPEDKYFMLFLLTNPKTKQCGIYEITIRQIEFYTGYNKDTIEILLERFENKYKKIKYDRETKEIAIKNWAKYNYSDSPKIKACIENELKEIKNTSLIEYVYSIDTVYIEYHNKNKNKNKEEEQEKVFIKEIIDYLNKKTNKHFTYKNEVYNRFIKARLNEGFKIDDFKKVIDTKVKDKYFITNPKYLSPDTLFRPGNFEKYLNERTYNENKESDKLKDQTDKYFKELQRAREEKECEIREGKELKIDLNKFKSLD